MDYFRTQSLSTYGFLSGYHCVLSFLEKVKRFSNTATYSLVQLFITLLQDNLILTS